MWQAYWVFSNASAETRQRWIETGVLQEIEATAIRLNYTPEILETMQAELDKQQALEA